MASGTIPKYNPKAGMFFSEAVFSDEYTSIPQNADLNTLTYTATGKYNAASNAIAMSLSNSPTNYAFSMLVLNLNNSSVGQIRTNAYDYRLRILMNYNGGIWISNIISNPNSAVTYTPWKAVQMT